MEIAATWLELGLDADQAIFYRLSDIPEISELTCFLTCITAKGLMNRAHAYKAAVQENLDNGEDADFGIAMGLFSYPILMAADIWLAAADGLWGIGGGVLLSGPHMGFPPGLPAAPVADAAPAALAGAPLGGCAPVHGVPAPAAHLPAGAPGRRPAPRATQPGRPGPGRREPRAGRGRATARRRIRAVGCRAAVVAAGWGRPRKRG